MNFFQVVIRLIESNIANNSGNECRNANLETNVHKASEFMDELNKRASVIQMTQSILTLFITLTAINSRMTRTIHATPIFTYIYMKTFTVQMNINDVRERTIFYFLSIT